MESIMKNIDPSKACILSYLVSSSNKELRGYIEVTELAYLYNEKLKKKKEDIPSFVIKRDDLGYPESPEIENILNYLVTQGLIKVQLEESEDEAYIMKFTADDDQREIAQGLLINIVGKDKFNIIKNIVKEIIELNEEEVIEEIYKNGGR